LPELARRFQPDVSLDRLPHPTPYPPPALLLGLPFAPLSYTQGITIWLVVGVFCLAASLVLLYRETGKNQIVGLALLLFAIWHPVFLDLGYGQVMLPVLLVTVLCWRALRNGHEIAGGLFLGALLAFKLFAWPVALLLLIRKQWKAALAAVGVMLAAHLAVMFWIGLGPILYYYLHVSKVVAAAYQYDFANFSPTTIGSRVFEGIQGHDLTVRPFIFAPAFAHPVSVIAMVSLVLWGMIRAMRAKTFDGSFTAALCLSLVASPIAWRHYLVLLALSVAVIASRTNWTKRRLIAIAIMIALALPMGHIYQLIEDTLTRHTPGGATVSFIGSLLGLAPLILVLSVLKMVSLRQPSSLHD
jgi:alpha-1,2-mannosyltransferase